MIDDLDDLMELIEDDLEAAESDSQPSETSAVPKVQGRPETPQMGSEAVSGQRIAYGRMPPPVVWLIRYREEGTDVAIARRYSTTGSKVNYIRHGGGFPGILEKTKFDSRDINMARAAIEESFNGGTYRGNVSTTTLDDAAYILSRLDDVPVSKTSTVVRDQQKARKKRVR